MIGLIPLPPTPSNGGDGVRRYLFPPATAHKGMDETASVSLMGKHESAFQLEKNFAGGKKVDVAEKFQCAVMTLLSHHYYPPEDV